MRESAHASEIALLEAYQQQARRFPLGVLAIGGDVLLMNRYLRQTLDTNDQTALLEHASDLLHTTATRHPPAILPSGTTASISVVDHAEIRGGRTNVVFHVHLSTEATLHRVATRRSAASHIPGLVGRSSSWRRSCSADGAMLPKPRLDTAGGREGIRTSQAGTVCRPVCTPGKDGAGNAG